MKRWKQCFVWMMVLLMSISLTACSFTDPKAEQEAFDEFMEQEVLGALTSDYMTVHQLIEDPSAYDIDMDEIEVCLGARFDEKTRKAQKEEIKKSAEAFEAFDRDALSEKQQDVYDLYAFHLETSLASTDEKFDYYEPLFQSAGGVHYQIPTTFADWELRNEQDVKDLIVLVKDTKPYLDSAIEYTLKQEELGLLMLDLDAIIEYNDTIIASKDNSAILQSLNEKIDRLQLANGEQYKSQLKEAFDTAMIPAYEQLNQTMNEIKERQTNHSDGLAQFEYGKEYYELLFQENIGSHQSVETIKKQLQDEVKQRMTELQMLLLKDISIADVLLSENHRTGFQSYEEIMTYVEEKMKPHFPDIGKIEYEIKDVNAQLASNSGIAAYFILPAIDSTIPNQLRVNPNHDGVDSYQNYITVAHEGFPGHMYQFAYAYQNDDSLVNSLYLNVLGTNGAYSEGWAVYAGYEALSYLDLSKEVVQAWIANEVASYAMVMLVDIGIHYDGWTYEDYLSFMKGMGASGDDEMLKEQYLQLQANPAIFQSYYVGYLEIMKLKELVQDAKGKAFDEVAFHEMLLEIGALPFDCIEERILAKLEAS